MNDGNIEFFSNAAHNLYSDVVPVHVGHGLAQLNFSTTPPRLGTIGRIATIESINPATGVESGYATYEKWNGDNFPRVICISRPMKGHAWHYATWADMVRRIAAGIEHHAPPGENTAQWSY